MKKHINRAPFVLTTDGRVVLNAASFDGPINPKDLLERALQQPGRLFVGVEMSSVEVTAAMSWTKDVMNEAAAYAVGARQRRRRRR